jgi:hypothetical protein
MMEIVNGVVKKKCYYCDNEDTNYCSLCKKWFCSKCIKQYGRRIKDMVREKIGN